MTDQLEVNNMESKISKEFDFLLSLYLHLFAINPCKKGMKQPCYPTLNKIAGRIDLSKIGGVQLI